MQTAQAPIVLRGIVAVPSTPLGVRLRRASARVSCRRPLLVGLVLLGLFIASGLLAPWVTRYEPDDVDYTVTLQSPSAAHPFGTDDQGRDILTRVIYGTRVSLVIAVIAIAIATVVGVPVGLVSGYLGGWVDACVSRVLDAMFAFPAILMAISVLAILGPGQRSAMIAIGFISIPEFARIARAAMIAEKEYDYVLAARATGCTPLRIVFRGILPNTLGPLLVLVSLGFAFSILNETALSYLGLGAQPPTPSWGADLATGRRYLFDAPWYSFFPGAAIALLVLSLNLVGDGIRDLTDTRD